ncbi:hypothetical protein PENSTE_c001G05788 [Penicillium steckii]|uniref:Uncharacterized protein n=1 Tax=Penicillium steckii TaxID=303698 RepID=A0A1V6U031_9EURO|nr:hypothetical protein PENSTE_c001G05788 [Penicillium steckii]
MLPVATAIFSAAIAALIWWLLTPLRTGLRSIPGPWYRQYSELFQVYDAYKGRTGQATQSLHRKYGPVVQIGHRTVSFSDPAMIDVVYSYRNPLPKGKDWAAMNHELDGKTIPSIINSLDAKTHTAIKRPIAGIFSMSNVTKSEVFINSSIKDLVKQFDQQFNGENCGKSFSISGWMHSFAYDCVMKLTLSSDLGLMSGDADHAAMFKGVDTAQTFLAMALIMPQLRTILRNTPLFKIFLARQGSFARVARETIQTRTNNGGYTTEETADLMSAFVEAQQKHPDVVSDLVLNGYVTLPIYAGSNSVAVGMTSILYLLGKHPRVQEKLHKSLVDSGLPMPPPWSQISKLTYLEAVIRECFRYHPATALLSRRIVPQGPGLTLPDGRVLPPGTTVAVNGCVTHFHKETYGDDVHTFRPERWLRDDNESEAAYKYRLQKMHKADLTFGHGEWVCIGNNIAKCEIHKAVATLYSIFEIELADPAKEWEVRETILRKQVGIDAKLSFRPGRSLADLAP